MSHDIAIIGLGCLLPEVNNYIEFKEFLYSNDEIIRPIDPDRWLKETFGGGNRQAECESYSDLGAQIREEVYLEIKQKYSLTEDYDTRLIAYVVECLTQVFSDIKNLGPEETDIPLILGCMNPDVRYLEEHVFKTYLDRKNEIEELILKQNKKLNVDVVKDLHDEMLKLSTNSISDIYDQSFFQTFVFARVFDKIKEHFKGRGFLVDAACASSLAAIDIACNQLNTFQENIVIAGGVESNLSAGTYVVFSRVGALAETTRVKPMDAKSEGMVQGEGCTLFALERYADAVKNDRKIYGVIKAVSGSSDGRSASLFQPTKEGQALSYKRVWKSLNKKPFFIEAHATGTHVGDETESQSIEDFFRGSLTYVGAIKSRFGHTKGNAGAVSLLKGLVIFEKNIIPRNPKVKNSRFANSEFVVNSDDIEIDFHQSDCIGVSSFGFGGCNYHLALARDGENGDVDLDGDEQNGLSVAVIKKSRTLMNELNLANLDFFPFPPKSLSNIDLFQIAAVQTVYQLFDHADQVFESLGKENINVVSCGKLGLNKNYDLVDRIVNKKVLEKTLTANDSAEKKFYLDYIGKYFEESIELSEDIGPGILNNVIAGRVSNVFDLHGKNYHIDKDFDSLAAGMYTIALELKLDPKKVFIVIDAQGSYDTKTKRMSETFLDVYLVTHPRNISALGLGQVEEIKIEKL